MKLRVVANGGKVYSASMAEDKVVSVIARRDEALASGTILTMTLNGVTVEFMPDQVRLLTFEWDG